MSTINETEAEYNAMRAWVHRKDFSKTECYRSFACGCRYDWRLSKGGYPVVPLHCPIHNDGGHGSFTVATGFEGPWNIIPFSEWSVLPASLPQETPKE